MRAGDRPERRVRRRRARPLPVDDDPQRGPVGLHAGRRQAADRRAGWGHRRRHGQRAQRRAPAGPDRRQLGGDDEGVDRRHRRLRPGRARRALERRLVGQGRRHAPADGRVGDGARTRVRLPERPDAARRRAERHHAPDGRVGRAATWPLLARRRCHLDRDRRGLLAGRAVGARHRPLRVQRHRRGGRLVRVLRHRRARPAAPAAVRGPVHPGARLHDAVRRHGRVARGLDVRRRRELRARGLAPSSPSVPSACCTRRRTSRRRTRSSSSG